MTAYIVQISTGDTPAGSLVFASLFAVGATLFVVTFGLTLLSDWVVARFRNAYQ
jgi:phosphate transport system permease protein